MASPKPEPPSPLVEKKGSKHLCTVSGVIPIPVSEISSLTRPISPLVRKRSRPPAGMASTALKIKLVNTSRSSAATPAITGILRRSFSMLIVALLLSPCRCQREVVSERASSIIWFKSTGSRFSSVSEGRWNALKRLTKVALSVPAIIIFSNLSRASDSAGKLFESVKSIWP